MKKQWTEEQRARQAQRIRERQPWKSSTGPKTAEGKQKSSRNAHKHGARNAEMRAIATYLAANKMLLKSLTAWNMLSDRQST